MLRRSIGLSSVLVIGALLAKPVLAQTLLTTFGDSITGGFGASDLAHRWVNLLAASEGWVVNDSAVGSEAIDQADVIYGTTTVPGAPYTYIIGTVDQSVHKIDPYYMPVFRESHEAEIAWLGLPPSSKLLGKSPLVRTTGTWKSTPEGQPGYNLGVASNNQGDSLEFSFSGATLYIGTIVADGNGGQFYFSVDGSPFEIVNCYSPQPILSPLGRSYAPKLVRIAGLSSGTHSARIVVASSSNPANVVYFDWAAGVGPATLLPSSRPIVYVGNVPRQAQDTTYVWQYSALVAQNARELQADGLDIVYVDDASYIDCVDDLLSDNAHPNDLGQVHVAQAFIDAIERSRRPDGLPKIAAGGVVNSFNDQYFVVAGGELVSVYGDFLGPAAGVSGSFDPSTNMLPTTLAGVSVRVGAFAAPLLYVSEHQINLQVPYEVGVQSADLVLTTASGTSNYKVAFGTLAPGALPYILNQDGTINSSLTPARSGDVVTIYGTGMGTTNPWSPTGLAATPNSTYAPSNSSSVTVGGKPAQIQFIGITPGNSRSCPDERAGT